MFNEIIPEICDELPPNYDSYSILLIPDRAWLRKVASTKILYLFSRLQRFCNSICANHISSWAYIGIIGSFSKKTDLEVISQIYSEVISIEEEFKALKGATKKLDLKQVQDFLNNFSRLKGKGEIQVIRSPKDQLFKIFISYAKEDRKLASKLNEKLKKNGNTQITLRLKADVDSSKY
jgi:hypothetical protein